MLTRLKMEEALAVAGIKRYMSRSNKRGMYIGATVISMCICNIKPPEISWVGKILKNNLKTKGP